MAVSLEPRPPADTAPAPSPRPHAGFGVTDVLLLVMALIWGVNFSVVKYGSERLEPLAYNGIRIALAAVALSLVVPLSGDRWPARRDFVRLLLLGALGNGLYQVLFIEGVSRTRAGTAALVLAVSPALVALLGHLRGTERANARALAGIALSIGGVALVMFGSGGGDAGASSTLGALLVLGGAACWASYTVLLEPYTQRVGGIALSAVTMIGGAVPLILLAAPGIRRTPFAVVPLGAWAAVAYSGLLALVVAYLFFYRGVRTIGPTRTAMYGNLQPAIALVVAWLTLGEVPTIPQTVGMLAIIGGILLTRR
jgi:drug/metabolite transporter (DMT)-like permease